MFYWNEFIQDINACVEEGYVLFDAGAGDGHWRLNIKKEVKYISMDLGVGDSNIDYSHLDIKGDLRSIPLASESVDVILCIQVLEHLPEPWKVIQEFSRILKPDGIIYLSCPQGEPQHQVPYDFFRYTSFGLESLFISTGFNLVWIKPQKGNFSKIANDLRMSGNLLFTKGNNFKGFVLKLLARFVEFFFYKEDKIYFNNTIGHFVKAIKVKS